MNKKIDCNRTINQKEKEEILNILYNSISKKINLNTNKKNKIFNRKEYDEIINKKINNFNEYKNPEYLNVK
jgi:coenzyme F420-reducing hydrogenase alpha subunit